MLPVHHYKTIKTGNIDKHLSNQIQHFPKIYSDSPIYCLDKYHLSTHITQRETITPENNGVNSLLSFIIQLVQQLNPISSTQLSHHYPLQPILSAVSQFISPILPHAPLQYLPNRMPLLQVPTSHAFMHFEFSYCSTAVHNNTVILNGSLYWMKFKLSGYLSSPVCLTPSHTT